MLIYSEINFNSGMRLKSKNKQHLTRATILMFHFASFYSILLIIFCYLGGNFESILNESTYKTDMTLRIKSVGPNDFGSYKCIAKNSLGETDSTIKLYSECFKKQKKNEEKKKEKAECNLLLAY